MHIRLFRLPSVCEMEVQMILCRCELCALFWFIVVCTHLSALPESLDTACVYIRYSFSFQFHVYANFKLVHLLHFNNNNNNHEIQCQRKVNETKEKWQTKKNGTKHTWKPLKKWEKQYAARVREQLPANTIMLASETQQTKIVVLGAKVNLCLCLCAVQNT